MMIFFLQKHFRCETKVCQLALGTSESTKEQLIVCVELCAKSLGSVSRLKYTNVIILICNRLLIMDEKVKQITIVALCPLCGVHMRKEEREDVPIGLFNSMINANMCKNTFGIPYYLNVFCFVRNGFIECEMPTRLLVTEMCVK